MNFHFKLLIFLDEKEDGDEIKAPQYDLIVSPGQCNF
jgi:hypothetical protein